MCASVCLIKESKILAQFCHFGFGWPPSGSAPKGPMEEWESGKATATSAATVAHKPRAVIKWSGLVTASSVLSCARGWFDCRKWFYVGRVDGGDNCR